MLGIELEQVPPDLSRGASLSSLGERVYRIDSPVGATRMPKSLLGDLRERVIEAVEAGACDVKRPSALRSVPVLQ